MLKTVKKAVSTLLIIAMLACMFSVSVSAAVTTDYDDELSSLLKTNYHSSLIFSSDSDGMTYWTTIKEGNNQSNMYKENWNERYNYVKFSAGKEFEIESKQAYNVNTGFEFYIEIFTAPTSTGKTTVSIGDLKLVTDYAETKLYLYYGTIKLAEYSTGLTAGSAEFAAKYACQGYTIKYIDGVITVNKLTDGIDLSANPGTIVTAKYDIEWTLANGTVSTEVPMPENADFGYTKINLAATSEIGPQKIMRDLAIGFKSAYNGNGPIFTQVFLSSNCGFSSLASYVDFVTSLADNLNEDDVERARNLYDEIEANGSDGLKSAVAEYESYILDAESALLEGLVSDYDIKATEGGTVYLDGAPFANDKETNPYSIGTRLTFSAVADAGYTFAHWCDEAGGIISKNSTINVIMDNVTKLTAVFLNDSASAGEEISVIFRDYTGNVKATVSVVAGTAINLPELPFAYGYTCTGWLVDGTTYNAGDSVVFYNDTVVCAAYSKNATLYSVTVSGAKEDVSNNYTYNTPITVTFDESTLKKGEVFVGWANNDTIVSYDKQYSFFVGCDVAVSAVIGSSEATAEPISAVTDIALTDDGKTASFLTERWLPDGYTVVKSGVIYTSDMLKASQLKRGNVNGDTIRERSSKIYDNNGQFRMNIKSASGDITVYLVSYMTYMNSEGALSTVYSSVYSASVAQTAA